MPPVWTCAPPEWCLCVGDHRRSGELARHVRTARDRFSQPRPSRPKQSPCAGLRFPAGLSAWPSQHDLQGVRCAVEHPLAVQIAASPSRPRLSAAAARSNPWNADRGGHGSNAWAAPLRPLRTPQTRFGSCQSTLGTSPRKWATTSAWKAPLGTGWTSTTTSGWTAATPKTDLPRL
jgi:hypothetical protein